MSFSDLTQSLDFSLIHIFPQQPERLGVLPIKLRGGLGQPPETLHQVPRGSTRFRKVPHTGSILKS